MTQAGTISHCVCIEPANGFQRELSVPGDKSISHRTAILAALSRGQSHIDGFLHAEDCLNTLRALEALGARVHRLAHGEILVHGTAGKLIEPAGPLDLGNSGTGMRLLAGVLAGRPMEVELIGDESLSRRPMKRIQDPLEKMGAAIVLSGDRGTAPMRIRGGKLKSIDYALPVASAQVKSCILLAGLYARGRTIVREPAPTRDHTERLLRFLGLDITVDDLTVTLKGYGPKEPKIEARTFRIPGDFSSAAFWIAAAAGRPGREVLLRNIGLNPRRTALLRVLERMGADIEVRPAPEGDETFEPSGDIRVRGVELRATEVGGADIPALIDELPLVAVLGAVAEGETVVRQAQELRVKESDRIATMVFNLRLMGVEAEEREDGFVVRGPAQLHPGSGLRSFGDHRVAMAVAILGLYGPEPICINEAECTETSYPGFWDDLKTLSGTKNDE